MAAKRSKTTRTGRQKSVASEPPRPPLDDTPPRFAYLVAALVLVAAICVLYPELVFQDKIFYAGDTQAAASFAAVGKEALARGHYPMWNPFLFAGMPSFGSVSYTPYVYPVSYLLGLFSTYLFFPKYIWLLFHTFLVGMGTYLLLRDRRVHWAASIAAGVVMMWMPNLVAVGANGHGSQACAVGYLPFALLFWDRIWRGRGTLANGAALVLVLGLSMLRGHLQISYYTYALIALHVVFFGGWRIADGVRKRVAPASTLPRFLERAPRPETDSVRLALRDVAWSLVVFVIIAGASLAMSSVLYIPVHEYAEHSIRGASATGGAEYQYATSWSLHPREAITFLVPFAYGFGKDLYLGYMPFTDYPNYLGLIVVVFAVIALVRVRTRFVGFLAFVAVVATFVSFGKFLPLLYDPLFNYMPYFSKFRVPVMVLIVQQLCVVILFAIGLDAALRTTPARAKRWVLGGLAVAVVALILAAASRGYWTGGFAEALAERARGVQTREEGVIVASLAGKFLANDLFRLGIMGMLLACTLWLYFATRRLGGTLLCGIILVLAAADLYAVDRFILHPESFRPHDRMRVIRDRAETEAYKRSDPLIEFLQSEEDHFRIYPMDTPRARGLKNSNRFMVFGVSSIGGYHPAKLADYERFSGALATSLGNGSLELLDILNVKYVVTGEALPEIPGLLPAWEGHNYEGRARYAYRNESVLPRVRMLDNYRVADDDRALEMLASGAAGLDRSVLLDRAPEPAPAAGGAEGATASITGWEFNSITVETNASEPCVLVLSEIYYPDWRAAIDGEPAPMLRANYILRGVAVPAGRHTVSFNYDMSLIKRCATISIATFLIVIGILVGHFVTWRRSRHIGSTDLHSDVQRAG